MPITQQLLFAAAPTPAVNNKAIDGNGTGQFTGTNTGTCVLTTTQANDVIIVMVHCEKTGSAQTVASVTSPHVTFSKRSSLAFVNTNNSSNQNLEVWWGVAASALSAETITITLSAATDDASYVAFGVSVAIIRRRRGTPMPRCPPAIKTPPVLQVRSPCPA